MPNNTIEHRIRMASAMAELRQIAAEPLSIEESQKLVQEVCDRFGPVFVRALESYFDACWTIFHDACRAARSERTPRPTVDLSSREKHVLRRITEGLSNRQVAESLKISERTVKFHVRNIMDKLGADNRTQAVAMAIDHGLI